MLMRSGFALPARTTYATDWREMLREHFVTLDVTDVADASRFTGAVRSASLAHLRVSTVQATQQRIVRNNNLIGADGENFLQLGLVRRGRAIVTQDDRTCVLTPGDFTLYDAGRPFDWTLEGHASDGSWALEVFTWPRHMLPLSEVETQQITAVAFDGQAGMSGLLGRFLHDVAATRLADRVADDTRVIDEVGDLIGALARTRLGPAEPQQQLYRAAVTAIDERLADPDLSPGLIAAELSLSTRHLHRIFADHHTTVSRTIRARRLEHCRRDLIATASTPPPLQQIAHRWGFRDMAVFSRTFKQEYGSSPRNYWARAVGKG